MTSTACSSDLILTRRHPPVPCPTVVSRHTRRLRRPCPLQLRRRRRRRSSGVAHAGVGRGIGCRPRACSVLPPLPPQPDSAQAGVCWSLVTLESGNCSPYCAHRLRPTCTPPIFPTARAATAAEEGWVASPRPPNGGSLSTPELMSCVRVGTACATHISSPTNNLLYDSSCSKANATKQHRRKEHKTDNASNTTQHKTKHNKTQDNKQTRNDTI